MGERDENIRAAHDAQGEALWAILRPQHPEALFAAALNRNLTEDMALFIAKSRSAPAEALGALAGDARFRDSYRIKLAICKNPRSPQRVVLAHLKHLRIFDLADLTRNRHIPVMLRQKVEQMLEEKVPALPTGIKTALSRRASGSVVMRLMRSGDRRVVEACLQSPVLKEEYLYKLINSKSTGPVIIRAIAEHPGWSLRYQVRFALVRNFYTPMALVDRFLGEIKTRDLQYLYGDPKLPTATRPFIFRELRRRGEGTDVREDRTYVFPEAALDSEGNEPGGDLSTEGEG